MNKATEVIIFVCVIFTLMSFGSWAGKYIDPVSDTGYCAYSDCGVD